MDEVFGKDTITTDGAPIAADSSARHGPTTPSRTSPSRGSSVGPSSTASSTSTSGPRKVPAQQPWPSSGTRQALPRSATTPPDAAGTPRSPGTHASSPVSRLTSSGSHETKTGHNGRFLPGRLIEAQFGPVRTLVMAGSDHRNHTVLARKLQVLSASARRPTQLGGTGLIRLATGPAVSFLERLGERQTVLFAISSIRTPGP